MAETEVLNAMKAQNASLADIYDELQVIGKALQSGTGMPSQSGARSGITPANRRRNSVGDYDDGYSESSWRPEAKKKPQPKKDHYGDFFDEVEEGISDQFKEALGASHIKDKIQDSLRSALDENGLGDLAFEDVPSTIGKALSKSASEAFAKTSIGKDLSDVTAQFTKDAGKSLGQLAAGDVGGAFETVTSGILAVGPQLATLAAAAGVAAVALVAIDVITDRLKEAFAPAIEGVKAFADSVKKASSMTQDLENFDLEQSLTRLEADIKSMAEYPYQIMEEAANKVLDVWDSVLTTITATQGYTKSDLQDLMSNYAQRLRDEGLTSVVSAADITENLSKVLESGLSGTVAEEFAYLATKLDAAIPTQEFFDYASTYASIAANAIQSGASEAEAIEYANSQLEDFASNVLYASRQIAGGFSTGLSDASELLADAVKISTSAGTNNSTEISGVLTSVAAAVGAVAPDLASDLVSTIVSAATGGNNDSTLTALRSLAGTGASNTAFLNALASDPQQVFVTLFENLAKLQTMSNDNFMEVAEGLADIFGVSMDAFARVDFNYLATAISEMNTNSDALEENLDMLISGQTTSTAEQLKMQEINEYILDEGLSYVLDNEVARQVQQHMWDEQLAREIEESTYGVELVGSTQKMLLGIQQTIENIINFLNPFSWLKKLGNVISAATEETALEADLKEMLLLGNVGVGNAATYYNLTTRDKDLNLTDDYVSMLGGVSNYGVSKFNSSVMKFLTGQGGSVLRQSSYLGTGLVSKVVGGVQDLLTETGLTTGVQSKYGWSTVGKSAASYIANSASEAATEYTTTLTASAKIAAASTSKFESFLGTMSKYVEDGKTYDEWAASATKYGIKDLEAAIDEYGTTEEELQSAFTAKESQQASAYEHERDVNEDTFWALGTNYWETDFPDFRDDTLDLQNTLVDLADQQLTELQKTSKQLVDFYDQWIDYYVNHTAYSKETLNAGDIAAIQNKEASETGDAVLALANALTSNLVDLKDPQVQTNVLLSQMLLVLESIMQQNNSATTVSLPTTLAGLGLGLTS